MRKSLVALTLVSVFSILIIIALAVGIDGNIVKTSFNDSFNETENVSETTFDDAAFNESANETHNTSNNTSNTSSNASASQYHTEIGLKEPPLEVVGEVTI